MNEYPERKQEFVREYIFAIVENMSAAFNLEKLDEVLTKINLLRSLKLNSDEQKEYIFFSTYIFELMIYIVRCEFDKGEAAIQGIEKWINLTSSKNKEIKPTELILYQNVVYIYFALKKYDKALYWVNKILNTRLDMRQDIYSLAHIFNLLIHY